MTRIFSAEQVASRDLIPCLLRHMVGLAGHVIGRGQPRAKIARAFPRLA